MSRVAALSLATALLAAGCGHYAPAEWSVEAARAEAAATAEAAGTAEATPEEEACRD